MKYLKIIIKQPSLCSKRIIDGLRKLNLFLLTEKRKRFRYSKVNVCLSRKRHNVIFVSRFLPKLLCILVRVSIALHYFYTVFLITLISISSQLVQEEIFAE